MLPQRRNPARRLVSTALFAVLAASGALAARASDPSALWHIVHGRCVPHFEQDNTAQPCELVDPGGGYAILKDLVGATQFLLIPTARVSGIEDPAILAPGSPNYWQEAWQARRFVEHRIGHAMPRDTMSLAINSAYGRTQDQLHIHIDCIRADVRRALAADQAAIGPHWSAFPVPLAGEHYRAMRIVQPLASVDPFRVLARDVPQRDMGRHTLVLVGAGFSGPGPGFVLLDGRVDAAAGDRAAGESLQDHKCALARQNGITQ